MYFAIVMLPLIGSLLATNRKCGKSFGPLLSVFTMFLALICCFGVFFEVALNNSPVIINLGNWVDLGPISIEWSFLFDTVTVSMYLPIVFVSFLIQVYSLEYMSGDQHKSRFLSILSLFSFAMIWLVTGENLFMIFAGWELVGVVSFLLISFWFTRLDANMASMSALFINKIGDMGFILALVLSINCFSDLSLATIFSLAAHFNPDLVFILTLFILIAGAAKSALFGMHVWLPKAMEGPTSVSALLHSSTMVTAGVFLLVRMSPLLEYSSTTLMIVIWLGALGALFGASTGLILNDIKGIIAMSTLSQLGYMIVAVGISQYSVALTHLIYHAFFKSLLFMSAGAVLHALADNQDIRKMGGLILTLPYTYFVFLFGSLSLMAFPFTAGFYSKDLILEILLVPLNFTHTIAYLFTLFAALFTSVYSTRTLIITFISKPLYQKSLIPFVKDSGYLMTLPLILLSLLAIVFGYFTHEMFLSNGSTFYMNSIFIHPDNLRILDAPHAGSSLGLLPLFFLLSFLGAAPLISSSSSSSNSNSNSIPSFKASIKTSQVQNSHALSYNFLFLNHFNILNHWLMHNYLILSNYLYRYMDKGLLELLGPLGLHRTINYLGFRLELISTGNIFHYSLIVIFSIILFSLLPLLFWLFSPFLN